MARMIVLTDDTAVAADQIAEINISSGRDYLSVVLKNGSVVAVYADYNKGIWETRARLITEINSAQER